MQATTLRSQFQLLGAASALLFAACAGAAAWLLLSYPLPSATDPLAWAIVACALGALALPLVPAAARARRLSASIASLESIAKALVGGAQAEVPPGLCSKELAQVCEKLVHAANVARAREFALRSADRVKDEFLATLAHELRNPLSALSAAAYVLRLDAKDAGLQPTVRVVERQVGQMTRLIEDLLDVARVTRGKVSLSREPLDLARLVEKAAGEMRLAGRLAQHELALDLAETWVRVDEARMQQVVTNLIGNAVKYTPEGGRIAVSLRRDRDEAILRVRDSGVGMSPELAARVFDLFVQGEASERRGGGGLGVGLALVKHLAELHGGKAFAASGGPGEGSVFTVTLPAIEKQAQPLPLPAAAAPGPRHRILLVEDNADARSTLFSALELQGHRVFEAADGPDGLRTLEAVKPDVALIDIGLPGLGGYDLASALRESPTRGSMVLIAMTGRDGPESVRRAREAGFDDYVTKPIPPEHLVRLIDAAFQRHATRH